MTPTEGLVLLADIGGTNARFAVAELPSGALTPVSGPQDQPPSIQALRKLKVADYPTPGDAVAAYLRETGARPFAACIAVAGPVTGDYFQFTNSPWAFSAQGLADQFGFSLVKVINDYEAQALGLPFLPQSALTQIGGQPADPLGPRVILGPGTGLGIGALVHDKGHYAAVQGEGGHISFAPQDAFEAELLARYWREHHRISAERLLAGFGLEALYRLMNPELAPLKASAIAEQALSDPASPARRVALRYLRMLGSYMGDLCLIFTAYGGMYLTGGVAQGLKPLLAEGSLRTGFEYKGRLSHIPQRAPIFLIETDETPFYGALYALMDALQEAA
jgi:glucokinase